MNTHFMPVRVRRQITDRDISVMRSLFDARILTVQHLADIHFAGSYEAARKRVMKLKADRWISERPRERVFDPAILHLTKKGFMHLKQNGHLTDFPAIGWKQMEKRVQVSPLTLRHELAVADVQAAFYRAARQETSLRIAEFKTWPRLFSFTTTRTYPGGYAKRITIRPDGFIRICRDEGAFGETHFCFYLEVDRSTETVANLSRRLWGYHNFQRANAVRDADDSFDEQNHSQFAVLIVCRSDARCRVIARESPPGRPCILLGRQNVVEAGPLLNVWQTPRDILQNRTAQGRSLVGVDTQAAANTAVKLDTTSRENDADGTSMTC